MAPALGLVYTPGMRDLVAHHRDRLGVVELSPDVFCRERPRPGGRVHLEPVPDLWVQAQRDLEGLPLSVHGLSLSIGTASGWNPAFLDILDRLAAERAFAWWSEHLGFLRAPGRDGGLVPLGVPLPLPWTRAALDLLVPRVQALVARHPAPFLLENTAHYLPGLLADPGWDEAVFLSGLVRETGCGLLLDLYNLWCNAHNHGLDPFDLLARLPLDAVVEIHVAGGAAHRGFWLDVHSQRVPAPVLDLLTWTLPRAPGLRAVVYELLDQGAARLGPAAVGEELDRLAGLLDGAQLRGVA